MNWNGLYIAIIIFLAVFDAVILLGERAAWLMAPLFFFGIAVALVGFKKMTGYLGGLFDASTRPLIVGRGSTSWLLSGLVAISCGISFLLVLGRLGVLVKP